MCFLIWNANLLEVAQEAQWGLAKYSLLIEIYSISVQESCKETSSCTAVNWKYEGNHECILRACFLPIVPPKNPLNNWKAYYQTTPTTTTTSTTFTSATTTTTTASLIDGSLSLFCNM